MSEQRSVPESGAPNRRNITLTVIVLMLLIAAGIGIGILSILWGGPVQPPPEDSGIGVIVASVLVNVRAVL